jgi:hypothetical protein
MTVKLVGIRQKEMLDKMFHYGNGIYPPNWRMNFSQRKILESLHRLGAVSLVTHNGDEQVYRITGSWEATKLWKRM